MVRRPGHHALVGRPLAQRVVRHLRLGASASPRRPTGRTRGPRSPTSRRPGPTGRTSCRRPTRSRRTSATSRTSRSTSTASPTPRARQCSSSSSPGSAATSSSRASARTSTEHAWGNTALSDLLVALEETSGRDLSSWAKEWLETAGLNTVRAEFAGRRRRVASPRSTSCSRRPRTHPTLRSHRIAIGLYDRGRSDGLVRDRSRRARRRRRAHRGARADRQRHSPTSCWSTTTISRTPRSGSTSARSRHWSTRIGELPGQPGARPVLDGCLGHDA